MSGQFARQGGERTCPQAGGARCPAPAEAQIPLATYRLQFNRDFRFEDARRIVPYLEALGISDVYASPYLKASPDSSHGYDVVDHNHLNPAIGSEAELESLVAELRRHGLGQIADVVPNHMGIAESANTWWMNLLENGQSSRYASFFDITWQAIKPELRNKVLLPILGDQYGKVLESGELVVAFQDGAFYLRYYDYLLPIDPSTYSHLLRPCLGALSARLALSDRRLLDLESILSSVTRLASRDDRDPIRISERQGETASIKRRLASFVSTSTEARTALEGNPACLQRRCR